MLEIWQLACLCVRQRHVLQLSYVSIMLILLDFLYQHWLCMMKATQDC